MVNPHNALNSHYNGDGALKHSHDEDARAIRTTSTGLPFGATRFEAVVDSNGNYTTITYYADNIAEETKIVYNADVSQSLNSTHFIFYSGRDKTKYYIWYSVDGNGVDPVVASATGIQVNIVEDDSAPVVALATRNAMITASIPFTIDLKTSIMTLTANSKGVTTDSTAETSGFNVTTMTQGETLLRATVELEYNTNCDVIAYSQDINEDL